MRRFIILLLFTLGLNCLGQNYPHLEILGGLSTDEKNLPFGNGHFIDSIKIEKGTYTNRSIGSHLIIKICTSTNTAFRLKTLYLSRIITSEYIAFSPFNETLNKTANQRILRFSPGYQWGIRQNSVEFFGGIEMPITYIGNSSFESTYSFVSPLGEAYNFNYNIESYIPGGFAIAGGLFFGTAFRPSQHFVFGFELSGNYGFIKSGGKISTNYKTTYGTSEFISYNSYDEVIRQIDISTIAANFYVGITF